MRPEGSTATLEARRRLAIRMLKAGQPQGVVANLLGVHRGTLWRWQRSVESGGAAAIAARPHLGARPRLSLQQRAQLAPVANSGPDRAWLADQPVDRAPGSRTDPSAFRGALPSGARAPRVTLHGVEPPKTPALCPRTGRGCHRALASLPLAGPQKKARRERRWTVFLDESGFMLQPTCRRSWAQRGCTPTLRCWARHDRRERHWRSGAFPRARPHPHGLARSEV